jgi:hypothetical protein
MYATPFAGATTTEGVQVSQFSDDKQARSRFALKEDFSSQSQCRTRLGCWFEKTDAWLTINRVQLNIPKSTLIYTYNPGKGSTSRHIDSAPLSNWIVARPAVHNSLQPWCHHRYSPDNGSPSHEDLQSCQLSSQQDKQDSSVSRFFLCQMCCECFGSFSP